MGEVLNLAQYCVEGMPAARNRTRSKRVHEEAQVVIFPGVRVERHTIDLAARHVDVAGRISGIARDHDSGRCL